MVDRGELMMAGDPMASRLDERGRSARPPRRIYYVTWGRGRLKTSRLYRDLGWARNRAKSVSSTAHSVKVYRAEVVWREITSEVEGVDQARALDLLQWAGTNKVRRVLLEEPKIVDLVRRTPRLESAVDWAEGVRSRVSARAASRRSARRAA